MSERVLRNLVLQAASRLGARLFRNATAMGWAGKATKLTDGSVLIRDAYPLHAGLCVGSSDCIGWYPVTITKEMVGKRIAAIIAVELKTGKLKLTSEQQNFLVAVRDAGGIGIVARSVDDATVGIESYLHQMQGN